MTDGVCSYSAPLSLGVTSIVTIVAACFGCPFPTSIYVGASSAWAPVHECLLLPVTVAVGVAVPPLPCCTQAGMRRTLHLALHLALLCFDRLSKGTQQCTYAPLAGEGGGEVCP